VLTGARQGRVDTLFLSTDAPAWHSSVEADALIGVGNLPAEEEQLDLAAVATLRYAGAVYAVPAARMPAGGPVAATLRY
jgi:hypothetical protein